MACFLRKYITLIYIYSNLFVVLTISPALSETSLVCARRVLGDTFSVSPFLPNPDNALFAFEHVEEHEGMCATRNDKPMTTFLGDAGERLAECELFIGKIVTTKIEYLNSAIYNQDNGDLCLTRQSSLYLVYQYDDWEKKRISEYLFFEGILLGKSIKEIYDSLIFQDGFYVYSFISSSVDGDAATANDEACSEISPVALNEFAAKQKHVLNGKQKTPTEFEMPGFSFLFPYIKSGHLDPHKRCQISVSLRVRK